MPDSAHPALCSCACAVNHRAKLQRSLWDRGRSFRLLPKVTGSFSLANESCVLILEMICGLVFLNPEMAVVVPRSGLKPGAAAFCSCTFPGKAGGVSFFCIKTPIIRGGLCEATHICARYVGQMCAHFLMKTKLDSVFFLQPGREKNTKFVCWLRKDCP